MSTASTMNARLAQITAFPGARFDPDPDLWSGARIGEDKLRALAVGAYYCRSWGAYNDTVAFLPEDPGSSQTSCEEAIDGLHGSWGVDNAADAHDTIGRLLTGMHAPLFELIHPLAEAAAADTTSIARSGLADEHREFLRFHSDFRGYRGSGLDRDYDTWLQAIKLGIVDLLPRPLYTDATAWDLSRLVYIARAAHTAGYLTEDEAWAHLLAGLAAAKQHYRNWQQFADGFLTGATFWAATQDLAAAKDLVGDRRLTLLGLQLRQTSPWRRIALHPSPAR